MIFNPGSDSNRGIADGDLSSACGDVSGTNLTFTQDWDSTKPKYRVGLFDFQ